jgi:hypothetical protein
VLRTFGRKTLEAGVQDGLQRLKRAAEARYGESLVKTP